MGSARVAIVEDEFMLAMELELIVAASGMDVVLVSASGEEAVKAAEHAIAEGRGIDLAIVDVKLRKDLDGIGAASRLRELCGPDLNLIFTTGYEDPSLRMRAGCFRPLAYLTKPINVETLRSTLAGVRPGA